MSTTATIPTYGKARILLGEDFIQPEELEAKGFGRAYSKEQLDKFRDTMPSEEVLKWCCDSACVLIAGPSYPIAYARTYAKFAKPDEADTHWIMLRKEPVPGSASKNWSEQQALLSEAEVTPNAAEVVWCLTAYRAVRGMYLLPNVSVRTSSLASEGQRVIVGNFDIKGVHIDYCGDDSRYFDVRLAAARKLD